MNYVFLDLQCLFMEQALLGTICLHATVLSTWCVFAFILQLRNEAAPLRNAHTKALYSAV